eukprot:Mycagemm_TRINITY_DN7317_c0_g1::TRINITY_DN7317_c0_g1_i1::g.4727::m.4727 type:complete len:107 gc:universal TRINITY_DN7317_c0_g1_i1:63-383(+)
MNITKHKNIKKNTTRKHYAAMLASLPLKYMMSSASGFPRFSSSALAMRCSGSTGSTCCRYRSRYSFAVALSPEEASTTASRRHTPSSPSASARFSCSALLLRSLRS